MITEIMEDKIIETITYIKSVSKTKPYIGRIKIQLLKKGNENNVWSKENLPNLFARYMRQRPHRTG